MQLVNLLTFFGTVLFVVNSELLTYNAALNRPAYQSSVWTDELGRYPAHLANDGSRHTTFNTGTKCAVSDNDTNPWWAVDLGGPTAVYRVDFVNIGVPENAGMSSIHYNNAHYYTCTSVHYRQS